MKAVTLAIILVSLVISACAHSIPIDLKPTENQFTLDISVGTQWKYADFKCTEPQRDTVTVGIKKQTWYWYKSIIIRRHHDSGIKPQDRQATVLSRPVEVVSDNERFGSSPGYWINTTAGLMSILNRTSPSGTLKVPSPDSPISTDWNDDSRWHVAHWDTLITVPAGEFRCIMIEYYGGHYAYALSYWAPAVGLIRREGWSGDQSSGSYDWQLVSYGKGVRD